MKLLKFLFYREATSRLVHMHAALLGASRHTACHQHVHSLQATMIEFWNHPNEMFFGVQTIEWFIRGGSAASRQITLTSCLFVLLSVLSV